MKQSRVINIPMATVIAGRGRGKNMGVPTINIDPASVPGELSHGIYACRITLNGKTYMGAVHYGPRPVFKDSNTFEVHIIDETVKTVPASVDIEIVGFIRSVLDFPSPTALVEHIQKDIEEARGMLNA